MMIWPGSGKRVASQQSATNPGASRTRMSPFLPVLAAIAGAGFSQLQSAEAAESPPSALSMEARITALIPSLEAYIATGMKAFDVPGLAVGIVAGDRLVYAKGFGVRSKTGGLPVGTRTVFQIGSTTKGFLSATMAIMADRGKFRWDDRVVDLYPDFRLKDAWVTREFRVFDLIAQRSGLPPYANDMLPILGYDEKALIRSLRDVEPVSSFRSTFAYTNITHLLAARIVANVAGAADWNAVVRKELFDPLGMAETTQTAEAIETAPDHAEGYQPTPGGSIVVPFTALFPYALGAAGDINSTVEDVARWVRLQLGNGTFEGRRIVSPENLAFTRTAKVGVSDKLSYAMGWVVAQTPNGTVIWHNGGTTGFGAYIGFQLDRGIGVIVLTNQQNVGFPDAVGAWAFDRLLDNPTVDYAADKLKSLQAKFKADEATYATPASPRPFPPLATLAGNFVNPSFGKLTLRVDGDAMILAFQETGAELRLQPWDGDIFTARLLPKGTFAQAVANLGDLPSGFAQFQMDAAGKLGSLRLSFDGQAYELRRE
jgi:CubicO group peptidase (beta-lactamase class C family)